MKTVVVYTIVAVIAVSLASGIVLRFAPVSGEVVLAQEEAQISETLMRQKLDRAQRLLEALVIADFPRMVSNAEDLQRISLEARWTMPHSPEYGDYGDEFRASLGRLVRAAEGVSIDGAALNYMQVILTCVQCHKVVREGEGLARLDDSALEGLLEQQLAAGR